MEWLNLSWDLHELENHTPESVKNKAPLIKINSLQELLTPPKQELKSRFSSLFVTVCVDFLCDADEDRHIQFSSFSFDTRIIMVRYFSKMHAVLMMNERFSFKNYCFSSPMLAAPKITLYAKSVNSFSFSGAPKWALMIVASPLQDGVLHSLLKACASTLKSLVIGNGAELLDLKSIPFALPQLTMACRHYSDDSPLLPRELPDLIKDHQWVFRFPKLRFTKTSPLLPRSFAESAPIATLLNAYYSPKVKRAKEVLFMCLLRSNLPKDICRLIVSKYVQRSDFYEPDLSWSSLLPLVSYPEAQEVLAMLFTLYEREELTQEEIRKLEQPYEGFDRDKKQLKKLKRSRKPDDAALVELDARVTPLLKKMQKEVPWLVAQQKADETFVKVLFKQLKKNKF